MALIIIDLGNDGAYIAKVENKKVNCTIARIEACVRYPAQRAELNKNSIAERRPYAKGIVKYIYSKTKPYHGVPAPYRESVIDALGAAIAEAENAQDTQVYMTLIRHREDIVGTEAAV